MKSDGFLFDDAAVEAQPAAAADSDGPWLILIVDDDPEVHAVTRLTLGKLVFKGRGVAFRSAFSAAEGRTLLEADADIAVVLLDVVMETDDAGLRLVREIRNDLGNRAVRIILRTGQPGQAPEEDVIVRYDINDYKSKTELTAQKLFTTVVAALRGYEDIRALESNRLGLQQIIDCTDSLFRLHSLRQFSRGVLLQLAAFVHAGPNGILCVQRNVSGEGDPEVADQREVCVLAGVGRYAEAVTRALYDSGIDPVIGGVIDAAFDRKSSQYSRDYTVLYIPVPEGPELAAYIHSHRALGEDDRRLLEVFVSKMAIGFANVRLYEDLQAANERLELRVAARTRELEEANRRLEELAYTDPLTGALNRRSFMEGAAREVERARRYQRPLSVVMFDLDHFKSLNDTYGHLAGDDVLRTVVARTRQVLRDSDILGRYGGEEFAILLPETPKELARQVAERLRQAMAAQPMIADGSAVAVTISLGVSELDPSEDAIGNTLRRADDAMYDAKESGRDRVCQR